MVADLNGDKNRQLNISDLSRQNLIPSSHWSKKRSLVEEATLENENAQLHEQIIHTIIKEGQTRGNIDPEIMNKLAVGIKKFWT